MPNELNAQQPDGGAEVLKPCPFCGAVLVERGDYNDEAAWNWFQHDEVAASKCIAGEIHVHVTFGTRQSLNAIQWNRRIPIPPASPEREAVYRAVDAWLDAVDDARAKRHAPAQILNAAWRATEDAEASAMLAVHDYRRRSPIPVAHKESEDAR